MRQDHGLVLCLAFVVSAGCQTSYLVARGDEALSRGEPGVAVADYLAAMDRRISSGSRGDLRERLDRAALALVEKEIAEARSLSQAGKTGEARQRLWRILVADAWGAVAAKRAVLDALEAIDRPRWQEIEALAASHRWVPAVRVAEALVTPYPQEHSMRKRLADLSRRGQEHHLQRAAGAEEPPNVWFHQRVAMSLGASPPASFAELERTIAASTAYAWRVEIDDSACPTLARLIGERLARSEQRGPVAEIRFERCQEEDRSWSEREKRSYADRVPRVRFIEEPYWDEERDADCEPVQCRRHDELGVCLQWAPAPAKCLEPRERRLVVRQVPVIEYEPVQKEIEVEVLRRQIEIEASGQLRFDGEQAVPFEAKEVFEDRAFWSPAESRRFSGTDRNRVVESAFAKVKSALDRQVAEIRSARAIAASQSAGEQAESLHVLAVSVSRSVPAPAAQHFDTHYGMSEQDVLAVLGGGALFAAAEAPLQAELPSPELDPDLDRFEHAAVARKEPVPGLAQLAETGVDLAFAGGTTALQTADRFYGLSASVRVSRLVLTASGMTSSFGGVGGFGLSMTGLAFDPNKVGFFFGWGLSYNDQRTDAGERYRIFTIPISFHVPIVSWLWVGASFEPNLLFTKTIFDDDEDDPHFWSPIRAWAVFDLHQRVFLQAAAAHYLGAGFSRKPVQAELMLGVRL